MIERGTWQALSPNSAWQHPTLAAIERELDSDRSVAELAAAEEQETYPEALLQRLRALGVMQVFADPPGIDPGASILTEHHLGAMMAMLGRRSSSIASSIGINGVALLPVYIAGTEAQRNAAFEILLSGGSAAVLLTEWTHGSDLLSNDTRAEPAADGSHYRLFGEKVLINQGARARLLVALARTRPKEKDPPGALGASSGLSLFAIERDHHRDAETLRSLPRHRTLPVTASEVAGVALEGHLVPASSRLGREGEGFYVMQRALSISRGGVPPIAAGLTTRALDLAKQHARARNLYGAPIEKLGAIAEHLLKMEVLDRVVNALAIKGASMINVHGQRAAYYTAISKFAACQLAEDAVTEGRRLMGAHGLLASSRYAPLIRDVILHPVFDGTRHVALDYIQVRFAEVATKSDPVGDPLEILREVYRTPPASLVTAAKKIGRTLIVPIVDAARALASLPGETSLQPLIDRASALLDRTKTLIDSGAWKQDQAVRFAAAEALAYLEALFAFVELCDPDRRAAIVGDTSDQDRRTYRYGIAWLGSQIDWRITELSRFS